MKISQLTHAPSLAKLRNERGVALVLCLLVLVIVLVIAVQLSYSVTIEERIAANSSSDDNVELVARGAFFHLVAQFVADDAGEIQVGDYELKDADTLAEPWMDPQTESSRKFSSTGEAVEDTNAFGGGGFGGGGFGNSGFGGGGGAGANISVSYTVVDLESRFNLNWLMVENENFKKHAEASLKRLIKRLGHPDEFYDALKTFVTGEGDTNDPNAPNNTTNNNNNSVNNAPAATVGENEVQPIPPRQLLSIDELWDIEYEGIEEILTAKDEAGNEVEGKKPLLDYLTVWNTAAINFNTADPELIVCWFPNQDKKKNNPTKFNDATRIKAAKEVILARLHLEGDENFDTPEEDQANADPNADANTDTNNDTNNDTNTDPDNPDAAQTTENEASQWIGKGPLKNHADIAKLNTLKFIYSEQSGKGPPKARGGAAAATNTGANGELSPGAPTLKNWYDAVAFRSRLYKITVTATQGANPAKVFEAIVFRGQSNTESGPVVESQVLQWREVTQ